MSFTKDEKVVAYNGKNTTEYGTKATLTPKSGNPLAQNDYHLIIQTYEKEAANWSEEDYAVAYHYKDVYSTRNFSERVQRQLNYYPGMHQTSSPPKEDPAIAQAEKMADQRLNYWNNAMDNPDAFMNGLRSKQQDFDYRDIYGPDVDAQTRAENIGKLITECIPCFDRLLDPGNLLPDGDLLEVHLLNIKLRTDLLDKLRELLKDPGFYIDICELLNLLSKMCPQDLLAMLMLLTQYLAKLNLDIKFNIDFVIELLGPILSPFLDALTQWLDKWIQMILGPLICVVDHINETIAIAQTAKIPFSEASTTMDVDIGTALPFHQNASNEISTGAVMGEGAWAKSEGERFNTPDSQKYNPSPPEYPREEASMAATEMGQAWKPTFSEAEREAQNKKWTELKQKQREKERYIAPPDRYPSRDGTRWSKDNIPNSEKDSYGFGTEYHPPEKQEANAGPKKSDAYLDVSPIVSSVVQLRNIMVGAIEYVKDWFTYATQMIYDLLGTDFGWMKRKMDNTILKSRIIQLIYMLKAIIEAIARNGLRCGTHTNFDEDQMKFILEDRLNKFSPTQFKVNNDGTIQVLPAGSVEPPSIEDVSQEAEKSLADTKDKNQDGIDMGEDFGTIKEKDKEIKKKTVESGIIIKNCLKNASAEELQKAKDWIADFEGKSS